MWKDMPMDSNVSKWNVTVLKLDKHKRHLDRATLQNFWEVLDKFVDQYRPCPKLIIQMFQIYS